MIRNALRRLRDRCLRPVLRRLERQEAMIRTLADAGWRSRAMMQQAQGRPIRVVFACHEPALWSMFESIYHAMGEDPEFAPVVVALPYRHNTLPEGQYKDAGMLEFCQARGIHAIRGYDKETDEWLDPASLLPNYIFFQTPYPLYGPSWSVESISMLARVCFIPYGTNLFRGEVDDITRGSPYFRYVSLAFGENAISCALYTARYKNEDWFRARTVVLSGHPKLDYLAREPVAGTTVWKRGIRGDLKRVLWTPRWRTSEGTCHFFDYRDVLRQFCEDHHHVDFVLRPHPLCLQNFLKTGELAKSDLEEIERTYAGSRNMVLDRSGDYRSTFQTSDILVSDVSSLLLEYCATGKPIVYTHRVNVFNELGTRLSEGFYWARNAEEVREVLEMLVGGTDPLREKRRELMQSLLFLPEGGAGVQIKEAVKSDWISAGRRYE